jgi:hypothetical protein
MPPQLDIERGMSLEVVVLSPYSECFRLPKECLSELGLPLPVQYEFSRVHALNSDYSSLPLFSVALQGKTYRVFFLTENEKLLLHSSFLTPAESR